MPLAFSTCDIDSFHRRAPASSSHCASVCYSCPLSDFLIITWLYLYVLLLWCSHQHRTYGSLHMYMYKFLVGRIGSFGFICQWKWVRIMSASSSVTFWHNRWVKVQSRHVCDVNTFSFENISFFGVSQSIIFNFSSFYYRLCFVWYFPLSSKFAEILLHLLKKWIWNEDILCLCKRINN